MRRSLLVTGKRIFTAFLLCFILASTGAIAQKSVPLASKSAKSSNKAAEKHHKKKHKKKRRAIVHHSDDDKKLDEIKAAKNKQKGIK